MTEVGILPDGFAKGPYQGLNLIGEVTESLHRFLLDGWTLDRPAPRIEEDLSFVPKDREEVLYVYMYAARQNTALKNSKQWRRAPVDPVEAEGDTPDTIYYERAPLFVDLQYIIAVHSRFRSDAERLLGWVMLRMHEASNLIYRPMKYTLPDGRVVDSTGADWSVDADSEDLVMEKVSMAWVDDFTIGDAINFFTIHEAPFRPFLTYQARCSMNGPLVSGPSTTVRSVGAAPMRRPAPSGQRPNGRIGRAPLGGPTRKPFGPQGKDLQPAPDTSDSEE